MIYEKENLQSFSLYGVFNLILFNLRINFSLLLFLVKNLLISISAKNYSCLNYYQFPCKRSNWKYENIFSLRNIFHTLSKRYTTNFLPTTSYFHEFPISKKQRKRSLSCKALTKERKSQRRQKEDRQGRYLIREKNTCRYSVLKNRSNDLSHVNCMKMKFLKSLLYSFGYVLNAREGISKIEFPIWER